jgi:hypothetical protein
VRSIAGLVLCLATGCVAAPEAAHPPLDFAHFRVEETPSAASPAAVSPGAAATAHPPAAVPSLGPAAVPSVSLGDEANFELGATEIKRAQTQLPSRVASHRQPPDAPPADGETLADTGPTPDVPADLGARWSGALIYCQPGCGPCSALERDLRRAGWRVGTKGSPHFRTVSLETLAEFQARNVPSTPCIAYFVDGQEVPPRIVGYDGTQAMLTQICARHPKAKKLGWSGSSTASPQVSTYGSPLYYESTDCGEPTLAANCGVPTVSYAQSVYSQPVVTSVTYSDPVVYSYPARYYEAAPTYQTTFQAGPATYSAGLSLFGFPLIGGSAGARF